MELMDIREFLEARLAEDEAIATAAGDAPWQVDDFPGMECRVVGATDVVVYDEGSPTEDQARHIARHDPARVLRDVEADRRLVRLALIRQTDRDLEYGSEPWPAERITELRIIAARWSDHPDYDPAWSPT